MGSTRRVFLAGAAAAAFGVACSSERSRSSPQPVSAAERGEAEQAFEEFVARCRSALGDLAAGRPDPYKSLWSRSDDVAIMGAFGGHERGWEAVMARLDWASKGINSSDVTVENVTTVAHDDLAFTVDLEHMTRALNGETYARTLRATHGYRRENRQWYLMFRHADELAVKDETQGRPGCPKER